MRLYMRINGTCIPEPIKIRSISFDNRILDSEQPQIYIRVHRKYEQYFEYAIREVTFFDRNGKVAFAAKTAWLDFRCYESDMHEDVKFRGIILGAIDLELPGIGTISKYYLNKILSDVCNAKLRVPSKKRAKLTEEERWKCECMKDPNYEEMERKMWRIERNYIVRELRRRRYERMYPIYKKKIEENYRYALTARLRVTYVEPVYDIFKPPKYSS